MVPKPTFPCLFYTFFLVGMIALTLKDFVELILIYTGDNSVTFAKSTWDNQTLNLPNMSVCFQLIEEDFESRHFLPNAYGMDLLELANNSQQLIKNRFTANITNNNFTDITADNNNIRLSFALGLLEDMNNFLTTRIGLLNKRNDSNVQDAVYGTGPMHLTYTYHFKLITNKDLFNAYDDFVRQGRRALETKLKVVSSFCRRFVPILSGNNKSMQHEDLCDIEKSLRHQSSIFSADLFCMPIPMSLMNIERQYTLTNPPIYTIRHNRVYQAVSENDTDDAVYKGYFHQRNHRIMLDGKAKEGHEFLMNTNAHSTMMKANFHILGSFTSLPEEPCSKATSEEECWLWCKLEAIRDICNCIPISYAYLVSNEEIDKSKFCTTGDFSKCWDRMYDEYPKRCQTDSCKSLCSSTKFDWTVTNVPNTDWGVKIFFEAQSFFYVEFQQVRKTSLSEFLSQCGGIMGLYLGFTVLSLYYVIILLYNIYMKQRAESNRGIKNVVTFWMREICSNIYSEQKPEKEKSRKNSTATATYKDDNAEQHIRHTNNGSMALDDRTTLSLHPLPNLKLQVLRQEMLEHEESVNNRFKIIEDMLSNINAALKNGGGCISHQDGSSSVTITTRNEAKDNGTH